MSSLGIHDRQDGAPLEHSTDEVAFLWNTRRTRWLSFGTLDGRGGSPFEQSTDEVVLPWNTRRTGWFSLGTLDGRGGSLWKPSTDEVFRNTCNVRTCTILKCVLANDKLTEDNVESSWWTDFRPGSVRLNFFSVFWILRHWSYWLIIVSNNEYRNKETETCHE